MMIEQKRKTCCHLNKREQRVREEKALARDDATSRRCGDGLARALDVMLTS